MNISPVNYYTSETKNAIPLYLIAENNLPSTDEISAKHQQWLQRRNFSGKLGESVLVHNEQGEIETVYIGAGANQWAQAMANAASLLPEGNYATQEERSLTEKLYWGMAQYQFSRYKKMPASRRLLCVPEKEQAVLENDLQMVFRVRDLINIPTNDLGPQQLAQVIESIAHEQKATLQQWVGAELLKNNFPAIHAVGRAAAQSPRLIHLQWGNANDPVIALVGKGVCFDSGGLDIKPSTGMRLMKKDMGGAAHAIALAEWIIKRRLPVRLHLLVAAVENAVGPDSYRPGDILTMRNGLTVEIDNTDAEGRLVLADALVKATEEKPEVIFDFATLTGAARVAVGTDIAAMFCNSDTLAAELSEHAAKVNDPVWRLPLYKDYEALLESAIADLLNSAPSSYAGAITAALFLQRFIQSHPAWVHFDIMAWNVTATPGKPIGGEAMSLRAIGSWLNARYK